MDFLKVPVIDHRWILNTPERNGILSDGPPKHANCNILGKGAYGTVFKAIFRDQPVAVKVVKNRAGVNRTENETHILGWKHRNIVRILKVESTVKFGIIIMEHFPGQSLQLISDTMEFPLVHRIWISLDILCALSYCHKHNLLHLDVKPQNVLVAFDMTGTSIKDGKHLAKMDLGRRYICKLCDFGSSMMLTDQNQTKLNAGGTVRYMAPEALRSDILSSASDIYSFGITMWQLKYRRTPYDVIECNEVVAFQVVKYNLRPNSDLHQFIHTSGEFLSPKYKKKVCRCDYYNTEVKCPARKKLQFGGTLEFKTLSPRGCYSAEKKDSNLSISISPIPRARKVPSNGLKSAVRNLQKELDFTDCKTDSIEFSFNLQNIFRDISDWDTSLTQKKEIEFNKIYQACWQSSSEKRPCSAELYKRLQNLLK